MAAPLGKLFGGGEGDGYSVGLRTRGVGIGGRNNRAARLSAGRPNTRPPRCPKSCASLRMQAALHTGRQPLIGGTAVDRVRRAEQGRPA